MPIQQVFRYIMARTISRCSQYYELSGKTVNINDNSLWFDLTGSRTLDLPTLSEPANNYTIDAGNKCRISQEHVEIVKIDVNIIQYNSGVIIKIKPKHYNITLLSNSEITVIIQVRSQSKEWKEFFFITTSKQKTQGPKQDSQNRLMLLIPEGDRRQL